MQQIEETATSSGVERKRVEAVVETLANLRSQAESVSEVAHDARNMVTALALYCDLLEEPGVLATPFLHYGSELRLVAAASRRLVEKLVALDARQARPPAPHGGSARTVADPAKANSSAAGETVAFPGSHWTGKRTERTESRGLWDRTPDTLIRNLAGELLANRNLLAALAGPSIALTVEAEGCSSPVKMTGEDLTRVLVNLVKNAAEAMAGGGRIHLGLHEQPGEAEAEWILLTVEDSGPGIAPEALETIFDSGYSTRSAAQDAGSHRGLGLAIVRSIVAAAGGHIEAANRSQSGARFEIALPVWSR
jgi:signal transduction histidine kinase